jgi:hypothetical protein
VGWRNAAGATAGGILVVLAFMGNAAALMNGEQPGWFPWPVFVAGMTLAAWFAIAALRSGHPDRAS